MEKVNLILLKYVSNSLWFA